MTKRALALIVPIVLLVFSIPLASAQKNRSGATITPAFQHVVIGNGKPEANRSFSLQNNSDQSATFEISTVDMGALDETGGLVFSGLSQDYEKKYGLAEWVELPNTRVEVAGKKAVTVPFVIKNQDSLSPGGHYGAIIVRQVASRASDKQVAISPQVASLVFLLKRGGEVYGLSLSDMKSRHNIWSLPTKIELPFQNTGNVHVVPRGIVRLKNPQGNEMAKTIINPESALILPERSRVFVVALDTQSRSVWPGHYTIEVDYRYDGQEKFTHLEQSFYTANLRILLLDGGFILLFGFVTYKVWKTKAWRQARRFIKLRRKR